MGYDHKKSLKQVAHHCIHVSGMVGILRIVDRYRGIKNSHMGKGRAESFSEIYESGAWVMHEGQESVSGVGSSTSVTGAMANKLSDLLTQLRASRIIDIGCGDFNWMRHVIGDREYIGLDIVPSVIETNRERFGTGKRQFVVGDAVEGPLPSGDIAICREVLFHLCFSDARRLLFNIATGGFSYVILTTDKDIWFNADIQNGDFRPLNLNMHPFNLPPAIIEVPDNKVSSGRVLGVWRSDQIGRSSQ